MFDLNHFLLKTFVCCPFSFDYIIYFFFFIHIVLIGVSICQMCEYPRLLKKDNFNHIF